MKPGSGIWPYVQIARPDHWFKNAFMLLGVVLAWFHRPDTFRWDTLPTLLLAVLAACIVSSSCYALNEVLDAPHDSKHPVKKYRPVPAGKITPHLGILEWLLLGGAGLGMAFVINWQFGAAASAMWFMGVAYNAPPLRTKEIAYVDVLTEAINNPLRLLMGWFALIDDALPSTALVLAYWLMGAFLMAIKRFAEYRYIGDKETAIAYRQSFQHYTGERLLVSLFFYISGCSLFAGIFIIRYKPELIVCVPFLAGFFAYYIKLGLKPDSPVQYPERLYREGKLMLYLVFCVLLFAALMFTKLPILGEWFPSTPADPNNILWVLDW
ncbi:MAG: UbiA family prenyltransferase [Planctomycetota bacterium]|jgi:4-hydroxybenzoate polyprenyltransferase